jgi:hypothetical protein
MDIQKRIRILEVYAALSLLVFGVLSLSAFTQKEQTFTELKVERLNVVEKNGQLRAVIANSDRMPDPVIKGKAFKAERPPGMVFYNGIGDECGGLVFGAVTANDKYGAYGGLTFDQFRQSQAIGLVYNDHNGSRQVGLRVWDRSETPLSEILQRREEIDKMPAGVKKEAARKTLQDLDASPTRVFVGKTQEKEAKVTLYDARGNARINMVVDASGTPRLEFLDANGKVTHQLPNAK